MAAPAMHQVKDVVAGLAVVFIISVGRIYISRLRDRRFVSDVVFRVVIQTDYSPRLIRRLCVCGRNR